MENKIKFIPRGNKVLLEAKFEVSTINILNDDSIKNLTPKSYAVVEVSNNIKDITVGDSVKLAHGTMPTLIEMPGDNQNLKAKQEIHKSGKAIVGVGTIKFHEYLLVDEFDIVGIWKTIDTNIN